MGGAIGAAAFRARATKVKLGRARVANRPFAGMLGQMQDAGAFLGAQNWLWNDLVFNLVQIAAAKPIVAR